MPSPFPERFFWGAATAAHQVEGNNANSDFWALEQLPGSPFREPSGDACDHYHRYRQDIALLAKIGLNSYRFSIEWARIEPEEGVFSSEAIAHYHDVLLTCYEHHLTPIVTLHHFTSPRWLRGVGGWLDTRTPARFAAYARRITEELGDLLQYVCTVNEANITSVIALTVNRESGEQTNQSNASLNAPVGVQQGVLDTPLANPLSVLTNPQIGQALLAAHQLARPAIKAVNPAIQVGLTLALPDLQSAEGGAARLKQIEREVYLKYIEALQGDDFLGVQTYTRSIIGPNGVEPHPAGAELTQMGYEFYPEGLEGTLRRVARHTDLPLLVSENGIATDDDTRRVEYIRRAVAGMRRCLADGLPIWGYLYWSALDNFEWMLGYAPHFGLIAVNRRTQERGVKGSAYFLGSLARTTLHGEGAIS